MKKMIAKTKVVAARCWHRSKTVLCDQTGENYVDVGVKILIAVVIGALLLAGLYALFGDVVMPTLSRKITEMFNYSG